MTDTDTATNRPDPRWENELDKHPRREDGRRELRQFHTAQGAHEGTSTVRIDIRSPLSRTTIIVLAVGNGVVMGGLLGYLFGVVMGAVAGVVAAGLGYVWVAGHESKQRPSTPVDG